MDKGEDSSVDNSSLTDIESFVARFYTEVLDRKYDESGLQNWTNHLTNNTKTVKDITMGFFKSEEFLNKNVSNSEFVTIAYNTLLGREPESQGYNSWINNLNNGLSRDNLLDGFINSAEFSNIAKSYGIDIEEIKDAVNGESNDYYSHDYFYDYSSGFLTNNSSSNLVIQDLGLKVDGSITYEGQTVIFEMNGTIETGIYMTSNFGDEYMPGFDFSDEILNPNESIYLNHFLPTEDYINIPGLSGKMDMELSLITTIGVFTDDVTVYL